MYYLAKVSADTSFFLRPLVCPEKKSNRLLFLELFEKIATTNLVHLCVVSTVILLFDMNNTTIKHAGLTRKRTMGRAKDYMEPRPDGGCGVGCPKGENWLSLSDGVVRCSRYVNGHAMVR